MTIPNIVQLPNLRPSGTVEEPPIGAPLQALAALLQKHQESTNQLLMHKGQLALEQEKFDAEQKQRNDKKKQLQTAADAVSHLLSGGQLGALPTQQGGGQGGGQQGGGSGQPDPSQFMGAAGASMGAGESGMGEQLLRMAAAAQAQARDQDENKRIGALMQGVDPNTIRTDPAKRFQLFSQVMGINAGKADQLDKLLPSRKVGFRDIPQGGMAIKYDMETGEPLGIEKGQPKQLNTAALLRIQANQPAFEAALTGMEQIEKRQLAGQTDAVQQVAAAGAAGKLPRVSVLGTGADVGKFAAALKDAGLQGESATYYMYMKSAVEKLMAMTPGGRGGAPQLDLWQSTIIPLIQEAGDPKAMAARQRMRRIQSDSFKRMTGQGDEPPAPGAAAPDPLGDLETQAAALK